MKKALVIYDTQFGSTKLLAEKIAEGIEEAGDITCKVENIKDLDQGEVAVFDAVLFGSPVHAFRATRGIQNAIKMAAKDGLDGKLVTTFQTHMGGHSDKAISKMEGTIRNKAPGARLVSPGFAALVDGYSGPLSAHEIPKAKDFGKKIGQEILQY